MAHDESLRGGREGNRGNFNDVTARVDGGVSRAGFTPRTCNRMRANTTLTTWTNVTAHQAGSLKGLALGGGGLPLPWQRVPLCVWTAFWLRARFFHREDVELEQTSHLSAREVTAALI